MKLPRLLSVGLLCVCWGLISCSSSKGPLIKDKVPLTHVKGKILVDGQPTAGVIVRYYPDGPIAETRQKYLLNFQAMTFLDGSFKFQTYALGDGVPAGEYSLVFTLLEQKNSGEFERLAEEFTDRKNPFKKIKVEPGADLDLGLIELKSVEPNKQLSSL